ncbi:hypothetical protein [Serratia sp. M24T3]|uniref:hypothetical protein n=1 Tax=Serratia sp. M24T3 TaxID=932213 RepID=UPI00025B9BF7|nr:hypothetical protein [Serratia sp. M24T3]EIC84126.1 hypothetical protein SPM24T3_13411 [Serratia sp. M24T3]
MKAWIWPLCLLTLPALAQAQDYRIAWSPGSKQAAYLDDVKSARASSWCAPTLPLRIVAQKKFNADSLAEFLPAVGALMHKECSQLTTLNWQAVDSKGQLQQKGTAVNKNGWKVTAEQSESAQQTATATTPSPATSLPSPEAADTAQISKFETPDACHFRTFWGPQSSALFFPSGQSGLHCDPQGWLNGSAENQPGNGEALNYLSGYPLLGLPENAEKTALSVLSANNQRLILANASVKDSWLILPYDSNARAWRFKGKMAIEGQPGSKQPAQLKNLSQQWGLTGSNIPLNAVFIEKLHPEWRNPAADTLAKTDNK